MAFPLWSQTKRSSPSNVQREFKGVNRLDSLTIDEQFASDISNVSATDYPVLKTRPGFSLVGSALAARILGLSAWKNSELNVVSNGQWYKFDGSAWQTVSGGGSLSTTANWSFTNFKGGFTEINLIGANGSVIKRYDGSTVQDLTNAPSGGNYVETYSDRLWLSVGSTLHFSEFRVGTNWTTIIQDETDPGFITIESPDGEVINAVKAGPRRLVIFKSNSVYNLLGSSAQDFTLVPIANDLGTFSNQSVVTIGGQIYFVHQTGVYVFGGAVRPTKDFSQGVQDYIDRINPAARSKVCMGTDGQLLYIGIPLDNASDPDTVLVYNPKFNVWTVWKGHAPLNMAQMINDTYIGGVEGQVRKVGGTTDNGAAISGYWTTKIFGAGSYSQRIAWKRGWIVADVPTGSTLQVYMSKNPDGVSDFQLVQNVPVNNGLGNTRVIIPTTTLGYANFAVLKFAWTGVVTLKEWSREEDNLPIY